MTRDYQSDEGGHYRRTRRFEYKNFLSMLFIKKERFDLSFSFIITPLSLKGTARVDIISRALSLKNDSRVRYSKGHKCKTLKFKQTASPKIKGMTKAIPFLFEIYSLVNFISGKTIAISFSSSFGFHHSMKRTVAVEGE